nr:hypothetical protein KPHV_86640 [Kitasatospora purpeofusca]
MTAPTDSVSERRVRQALAEMTERAADGGPRPSVLALARKFAMSNTTFRRRFPYIAAEISQARTTVPALLLQDGRSTAHDKLVARNARLKRVNREQADQLKLAAAQIQRITLDNQALREALQAAQDVTPIRPRGSPHR